jgi:hypothetical protein
MWTEIGFNIAYLIAIWVLVYLMSRRQPKLGSKIQPITQPFVWAFALLALGDTGHVGFRVWAYAAGGLEKTITLFGKQAGLVGLGALSTAITVTFFYVLMLLAWQRRYGKAYGWFGYLLLAAAVVRLVIMAFPQNQWNNVVPPEPWSLYRNIPLTVLGLGVAFLIERDARAKHDRVYRRIGNYILVSFAFYIPVILYVQEFPWVGMLMIPKTLAYVAIAWVAYQSLFKTQVKGKI